MGDPQPEATEASQPPPPPAPGVRGPTEADCQRWAEAYAHQQALYHQRFLMPADQMCPTCLGLRLRLRLARALRLAPDRRLLEPWLSLISAFPSRPAAPAAALALPAPPAAATKQHSPVVRQQHSPGVQCVAAAVSEALVPPQAKPVRSPVTLLTSPVNNTVYGYL